MCSSEDKQEQHQLLKEIRDRLNPRAPIDLSTQISTAQPLIVDYKNRKHLFLWSANNLTLTLEDLGQLIITANSWTNISYQEGMRLVPQNQAALTPVFVRATDETIP